MRKTLINCSYLLGLLFCAAAIIAWHHHNTHYSMANHSFLFGTPLEKMLKRKLLVSAILCTPLILPIFIKRSKLSVGVLVLAGAIFPLYYYIAGILTD